MTARRWFHVLLGAAFLPGLTLPLVWIVALKEWRGAGPDRRWAVRLLALAVVDTLVVLALIALAHHDERPVAPAPARRLVIGVVPDRKSSGPGVRVGSVTPGGPAEKVGLRAGDVIESIEGEAVTTFDQLRHEIGEASPDDTLELRVHRGESEFTVEVEPVWSDQVPRQRRTLFEPERTDGSCLGSFEGVAWKPIAVELALLGVLALAGWRRGAGAGVWLTMIALLLSTGGALVGWIAPCLLVGGLSMGGVLLSMWGTSLGLVLTGLAGRAWVRPPPIVASRSVSSTVLLGVWYTVTGAIRLAVVLGALRLFLPSVPQISPVDLFRPVVQSEGPGLLFVVIGAVVLAPLGEELVFRGTLLPSLIPWAGTTAALWVSAIVFGGLHWYYGVMTPVIVLFGWVLGWARIASGGLRAPFALHALINLLPVTVLAIRH